MARNTRQEIEQYINQIIHGDCIETLESLPDASVHLIFADPPYNLQLQNELIRPNQTVVDAVDDEWDQFDNFAEYDAFTEAWLSECRRVLREDGTIWVIGSYHNIYRVGTIMMNLGYWILNDVHWHKTNPMPNFRGTRFTNATESLIWAKKSSDQKKYTFNYHSMKNLNDEKQMQNVWHIPLCTGAERIKINGKKAHSTQKPEALLYRVLQASSNPGDIVLDPFFGSGTTGAVAKKLKRQYIGIEREARYVEVAQERIEAISEIVDDDSIWVIPSKRKLPRVAFGRLLEAEYITPGQRLLSPDGKLSVVVRADAHLICGDFTGSIHKVAAHVIGKSGHNGWEYWHIRNEKGELVPIDTLRMQYRETFGLT